MTEAPSQGGSPAPSGCAGDGAQPVAAWTATETAWVVTGRPSLVQRVLLIALAIVAAVIMLAVLVPVLIVLGLLLLAGLALAVVRRSWLRLTSRSGRRNVRVIGTGAP